MRCIKHPNVINMFEVYQSYKNVWMVLELTSTAAVDDHLGALGSYAEAEAARVREGGGGEGGRGGREGGEERKEGEERERRERRERK